MHKCTHPFGIGDVAVFGMNQSRSVSCSKVITIQLSTNEIILINQIKTSCFCTIFLVACDHSSHGLQRAGKACVGSRCRKESIRRGVQKKNSKTLDVVKMGYHSDVFKNRTSVRNFQKDKNLPGRLQRDLQQR